jgi:hypothetical protein
LRVFDTVQAVRLATVDVPTPGTPSGIAIVAKPAAPTDVSGSVVRQSATVRWNEGAGPLASAYLLEVGFSAGVTNLTVSVPAAFTEYAVASVPSGTYYVRIRAMNAAGALSAPSAEVQVVIP